MENQSALAESTLHQFSAHESGSKKVFISLIYFGFPSTEFCHVTDELENKKASEWKKFQLKLQNTSLALNPINSGAHILHRKYL